MANPYLKIDVTTDAAAAAADIDKLSGSFTRADDAAREASSGVGDFGDGVGNVSSALSGIGPAVEAAGFPGLASAIDTATIALDAVEGATMLFTTAQQVAANASKGLAIAQKILNAAMRANPIGIIITVILLLVGAIILAWKKSTTFRNVVLAVWGAIKRAVAAVVAWFRSTVPPLWQKIQAVAKVMASVIMLQWRLIKAAVSTVLTWIKTTAATVWNAIKTGVNTIRETNAKVWSAIKDKVKDVMTWIKDKVTGVFDKIKSAASSVRDAMSKVWGRIKGMVQPVVDAIWKVVDAIRSLIDWISKVHVPNWLAKLTGVQQTGIPSKPPAAAYAVAPAGMSTGSPAVVPRRGTGAPVIQVMVPPTANPVETGRQIVKMIRQFEANAGTRWRTAGP